MIFIEASLEAVTNLLLSEEIVNAKIVSERRMLNKHEPMSKDF